MPVSIHFVGSVPLASTEDVFETLCTALPSGSLKRIPDGETAERHYFVRFQFETFARAGVSEVLMNTFEPSGFRLDHTPEEVEAVMKNFPKLETRYDTAAIESYKVFRQLKDAGVIPAGVKFQVSLPSAVNFIAGAIQPAFQSKVETHFEAALLRAIRNIQTQIPHEELAIQLDLAIEFGLLHGALDKTFWHAPVVYLPVEDKGALQTELVKRILRLVETVEKEVDLGFHMCYGDFGKTHFIQPPDTGTIVDVALDLFSNANHQIKWIHFPVPKDRDDEAYLAPLTRLLSKLGPETELHAGLVIEHDMEGTRRRFATTKKFFGDRTFGIGTECGLGRRTKEDLDSVLEIMRALTTE